MKTAVDQICKTMESQLTIMRLINSRIQNICADVRTVGISDEQYREIDQLRLFVNQHCKVSGIYEINALLQKHAKLVFEIGG